MLFQLCMEGLYFMSDQEVYQEFNMDLEKRTCTISFYGYLFLIDLFIFNVNQ